MAGLVRVLFLGTRGNGRSVRTLGVVLAALACAAVCASPAGADTGASTRARLVNEVEQGLVAANQHWGWKGWYQDFQGVSGACCRGGAPA